MMIVNEIVDNEVKWDETKAKGLVGVEQDVHVTTENESARMTHQCDCCERRFPGGRVR